MKYDLGGDVCGNDWVSQDATELLHDAKRVYHCHLQCTCIIHVYTCKYMYCGE